MKLNIALMTGGDSSEWQIALKGAQTVQQALDPARYNVYRIMVRGTRWWYTAPDGTEYDLDRNDFTLTVQGEKIRLDYALIIIHGTPGEDGHLQAYLDMMHIPYSSCGMVSSVLTFDKAACKRAVAETGVYLAREVRLNRNAPIDTEAIVAQLGLPLFVKPNTSGSSFGVTKVKRPEELVQAVQKAWQESDQALLEEFIEGREISCGVMIAEGKEYIFPITELICETEFFDYEAKYEGLSREVTPADLPASVVAQVNRLTLAAYKALNCRGVVRIDFIIKGETPYLIEVNTIPGMSAQSIIPQQAAAMGMSLSELFDIIIRDTCPKA